MDILQINAHLKYVEFLLDIFDKGSDELTLGEIRDQFKKEFNTLHPLWNQNFGIYRLMPIILMREVYKKQKKLADDIKKIRIIRNAVVHNNFTIDEYGYTFKNKKEKDLSLSYKKFVELVHRIEDEFYRDNNYKSEEDSMILQINAHLKYVEFLLRIFDYCSDKLTLGEIRNLFKRKFNILDPLLNQYFGVYRLMPIILMKEVYKKQGKELVGDIEKIKIIRDAIVHYDFIINEHGYTFKNKKEKDLSLSYKKFVELVHRIEDEFYRDNNHKNN